MDEDIYCPRCRTTKYRNPSLKLMVNVCGHALCENCVEMLFIKGAGKCPECDMNLRRAGFREQLFEDPYIEKETQIRKKILQTYNKREDDFKTLREYNDYLEEVETIIFNLANDVDVEETRKQIEEYKKTNKETIERNRYKKTHDEFLIDDLLEKEEQRSLIRKKVIVEEELQLNKMKIRNKEDIVDQLMKSDLPATLVLQRLKEEQKNQQNAISQGGDATAYKLPERRAEFSSGIRIGGQTYVPPARNSAKVQEEPYVYTPLEIEMDGPAVPKMEDIEGDGYLLHVRPPTSAELAGGFQSYYPCMRALQEAFNGLYYQHEEVGESHHLHDDL